MTRWIAFLRAINVGGHTVKMDQLRTLFSELGFTEVQTFIASGNVIFESDVIDAHALETQIATHLQQRLGYAVATFLRSPSELSAIVHHRPFSETELNNPEHTLFIGMLPHMPDGAAQARLIELRSDTTDDFHFHEREVYWLRRSRETKLANGTIERKLKLEATFRNVTTMRKMAASYG